MEIKVEHIPKNQERLKLLAYYFAIGDALGKDFEFLSPSYEQLKEKFYGESVLEFTDDTYLLLSTCHALESKDLSTFNKIDYSFYQSTIEYLQDWFISDDLRGVGTTTYSALKQIYRYGFNGQIDFNDTTDFVIDCTRYNYSISAGNGILSRALPLCLINIDQGKDFTTWLNLTHLHTDGHDAVKNLFDYTSKSRLPGFPIDEDSKGYYAPEALSLAINAVLRSKNLFELFVNSQVADGDNDSIAALAFGLWYLKNGANQDDLKLLDRFSKNYLEKIGL